MSSALDSAVERFSLDRETLYRIGVYVVMYGLAFLFAIPLFRMFTLSMTPSNQLFGFSWIPGSITVQYWVEIFTGHDLIYRWIWNTLVISTITTTLVLIVDSTVAFALTRLDWPGKRVLFGIIIASFMVPPHVNIIPLFTLITQMGWTNSYWAIILPFTATPLGVFLLVQFFRDIPEELEESARMDGFSTFRIYAQIILPLSLSVITALALFMFVWSWNQYLWPLIVLNNDVAYTLPVGATTLQSVYADDANRLMAGLAVISLPLFVVFLLFQDKLISSVQMQAGTG
ncbi:carbohydrate ABC transporter membrane protein 2, CUT1 family [Halomicrobium zhouii]|uniref:Carbohydrate ABC transporter membrane protein 2, CUT1 family n=1 Tax=Halomicrobium zhouii TaxID=767519 RepID=A0A1I6L0R9_9EURY|nr:carbohydrate ABC transporter permease [Halomicrobium zhouii]SFR97057.1 carbohydrate ABC transporter membrane protein 2, CUT1 family [Halomicrobium zhouii]